MTENWLPIPGFEGSYEVSDLGRVRSLGRTEALPNDHSRQRQDRVLRGTPNGSGYPIVSLPEPSAKSGYRSRAVHNLVTLAFLGPRPEGQQVRHLNGDRANCALSNLAYGTAVENEADKRRHGTHWKTRLTHCPLDHRLAPPNLVAGALKRGHRNCLACARGRAAVRRGAATDLRKEADRYYRAITDQAVGSAATGA